MGRRGAAATRTRRRPGPARRIHNGASFPVAGNVPELKKADGPGSLYHKGAPYILNLMDSCFSCVCLGAHCTIYVCYTESDRSAGRTRHRDGSRQRRERAEPARPQGRLGALMLSTRCPNQYVKMFRDSSTTLRPPPAARRPPVGRRGRSIAPRR